MHYLENINLLNLKPIALFCSVKCPGELILKTYELCLKWRKEDQAVISGFHSPMEKECLRILLKGTSPVIISPARGIWRRIPKELKHPIDTGRLLIVTNFDTSFNHITRKNAIERNKFIGSLVENLFISFAVPHGILEILCRDWIKNGKHVFTFASRYNSNLLRVGAVPWEYLPDTH